MELGGSAFEVENAKSGRHWAGLRSALGSEEWSALGWASIGVGQRGVVGAGLGFDRLSVLRSGRRWAGLRSAISAEEWSTLGWASIGDRRSALGSEEWSALG